MTWPLRLSIGLLLLALFPMPYGYYELLRLVVFLTTGSIVYRQFQANNSLGVQEALLALTALAYNPVFRIHLNRELWGWVNLVTVGLLVVVLVQHPAETPESPRNSSPR